MQILAQSVDPTRLKQARDALAALTPGPWELVHSNRTVKVTAGSDKLLANVILDADRNKSNCAVVLPMRGGLVTHIVVTAPLGKKGRPEIEASYVIFAQEETLVWIVSPAIPAPEAQAIAARLAKQLGKGAAASVGKAIPLPGSMSYKLIRPGLSDRRPVGMMAVTKAAYRLADGRLARPTQPASKPAYDPRALTVRLGQAEDGTQVAWQPGSQANGFKLAVGGSGAGKTFALRIEAEQIHKAGIPVLVLDFHGDVEVPGIPTQLLSSGTDSTHGINPMELDGACARQSGLYDQRGTLIEMITRACPMLGHRQRNALIEAMEQVYIKAGILDGDPATWDRAPPTFRELVGVIEDDGLKAATRTLFGHPIFQRSQHVRNSELLSRSTRLDLSKLSDDVRFIATETILQRLFRDLRMRGSIPVRPASDKDKFRLFVIIDEVQILSLGGGVNVLDVLFREARKFGLGMILGTQSASNLTKDCRANASSWLVLLHNEMAEAKQTAPNIGVDPDALMKLKGKGDGYYMERAAGGARRVQVRAG